MQYSHDHTSALLHDLDVTGAEYRTAVQDLSRTIADGKDLRASDPAFVSAYEAALIWRNNDIAVLWTPIRNTSARIKTPQTSR